MSLGPIESMNLVVPGNHRNDRATLNVEVIA